MIRLPRNLGSLIVAFALACLVWWANAMERRERISEREIEASLTLVNVPKEMAITSEVPRHSRCGCGDRSSSCAP
jgi:hypothetical protein